MTQRRFFFIEGLNPGRAKYFTISNGKPWNITTEYIVPIFLDKRDCIEFKKITKDSEGVIISKMLDLSMHLLKEDSEEVPESTVVVIYRRGNDLCMKKWVEFVGN